MCACSWRCRPILFFFRKNISIRWRNMCFNGVILDLKNPKLRTKSRHFTDNSVGWNLATNSFHQHVRLLVEISPHTCFSKTHFDPMEEYVFQWRHFVRNFRFFRSKMALFKTHVPPSDRHIFPKRKVRGDIYVSRHMLVN